MDDRDLRDLEDATRGQLLALEKQIAEEAASLRSKYGWTFNRSEEQQAAESSLAAKEMRREALQEQLRSVGHSRHDLVESQAQLQTAGWAASEVHKTHYPASTAGPVPTSAPQAAAEGKMGLGGFVFGTLFALAAAIFALQMIFWVLEVGVVWFAIGAAVGIVMLVTGRLVRLGRVLLTVGLWSGLVATVGDWSGPGWMILVLLVVMAAIAIGVAKLPTRRVAMRAAA